MATPVCIWELGAELGEGPVWLAEQNAICLVDIKGRQIHRCAADGSARRSWSAPDEIGFALPMQDGDLVCGLPGRLMRFSFASARFEPLLELERELPGNRLNDGAVDSQGQLWFGSMDNAEAAPSGSLYRLARDGKLAAMDSGYVITNGPAFSPDGKIFYHTDTLEKTVYQFDVDQQGGLSNKRIFVRIAGTGYPDGSTVDAGGFVWIALFGGGRAERYSAAGALVETVVFPCPNITKLAFGDPDLRTAFASTARKGLTAEQLSAQPLAGGLFSFGVDTPGLPQHQFIRTSHD